MLALGLTAKAQSGAAALPGTLDPSGTSAPSLRALLTAPLFQRVDEGELLARTADLRACFDRDGVTLRPVLGRSAPEEAPLRLVLSRATVGGAPLALTAAADVQRDGDAVRIARGPLTEVHHVSLHGIEQTFVLDELPSAAGELVLHLAVETALVAEVEGEALRFVHATHGHLAYGAAFAVDGAGARTPIARVWTGREIELRVPAEVLANAVPPVTIDPLIQWFSSGFGVNDDARPDVVYAGRTGEYLVCWEEYTSAANSDVYLTKWDAATLTQGPAIAIEMGNTPWVEPKIAYSYSEDVALVVANANPVPMGLPAGAVVGRLVDVGAFAPVGSELVISTIGALKHGVDVGGSNRILSSEGNFCVVWSQDVGGEHDVRYRVVGPNGAFVSGVVTVDGSAEDDVTPSVSKSLGGGAAGDLSWTMTWIREVGAPGDRVGRVLARRVAADGNPTTGAGVFTVDAAGNAANPVASPRFDAVNTATGDRPSLIAFERVTPSTLVPGTTQGDISLRVVTDGMPHSGSSLTAMEDFDAALDQRRPSIASNGFGFVIGYLEEKYDAPGSGDFDVCMATGGIAETSGQGLPVLAERHRRAGYTTLAEGPVEVTMRRDGHPLDLSGHGALVWARQNPGNTAGFGGIHGVTVEHDAATLAGPRSVGWQYCDAEPNSVGWFDGRNSSWLRILGNQSVGSAHTAECVALPSASFGYLLVAPAVGDVLFPGGSQGRLCLSGAIGRYVDQVQSSGGTGTMSVTIDPAQLPRPTGAVGAVPGETWYFQLWHRDSVNGVATSNFSNACALHFRS